MSVHVVPPGLAKIPPLLKKAERPREKPPAHPSTPRGRAQTCLSPASGNLAAVMKRFASSQRYR
ncbi:hypothetical protein DIPPA_01346 [Diplonema papillatum]|nr:hypothetical protein DIPPA_01346 [Diplonema papillatum]